MNKQGANKVLNTPAEVREAAIRLLARREHSRCELQRKLSGKASAEVLQAALDQLERDHLLSDERFTEVYVRHRAERGYGPLRIAAELREKGVAEALIGAYLDSSEAHWKASALRMKLKRFGAKQADGLSEQARQKRYLMNRGFTVEQILYAVRHLADDEQGDV